jgi:hypothetical protein
MFCFVNPALRDIDALFNKTAPGKRCENTIAPILPAGFQTGQTWSNF